MSHGLDAVDEEPAILWLRPGQTPDAAIAERYGASPLPPNVICLGGAAAGLLAAPPPVKPKRRRARGVAT